MRSAGEGVQGVPGTPYITLQSSGEPGGFARLTHYFSQGFEPVHSMDTRFSIPPGDGGGGYSPLLLFSALSKHRRQFVHSRVRPSSNCKLELGLTPKACGLTPKAW